MSNLVVQTNVLALNSHRNLKVIGTKQSTASARLSSGYRINSAADDASGLAISEKMRAQIRGLDMASKNTQDGMSLVQTAEGGMQEIDNMVQRIRELAVQASNDTNDFSTNDRKKIQDEINQLTQGIDAMSEQVEFNAKTLLDGSLLDSETRQDLVSDITLKLTDAAGAAHAATDMSGLADVTFDDLKGTIGEEIAKLAELAEIDSKNYGAGTEEIGGSLANSDSLKEPGVDIASVAAVAAAASSDFIDTENKLSEDSYKAYVEKIDTYISALKTHQKAGATDLADELKAATDAKAAAKDVYAGLLKIDSNYKSQTALNAIEGEGLWFQTGANSTQGINVGVGSVKTDVLGIGDGSGNSFVDVNQASGETISAFINIVDDALQYVTAQRAKLGAVQNRMEYTKSSLDISSENLSASESRIRDTDMAKEMMKMTAANVLQQAGVSMLSQANQAPQSVLQLLG